LSDALPDEDQWGTNTNFDLVGSWDLIDKGEPTQGQASDEKVVTSGGEARIKLAIGGIYVWNRYCQAVWRVLKTK